MNRKELIAILLLATLVAVGLVFRLYYAPTSAFAVRGHDARPIRPSGRQAPGDVALSVGSRVPHSRGARELLQRAEGAFSYAVFSYAAGQESNGAVLKAAADMYHTFRELFPREEAVELAILRIGQCYTIGKRHPEAARTYDYLIQFYPKSEVLPMALLWSGESHLRLGDTEAARKRFQEAVEKYPNTHIASDAAARLSTLPKSTGNAPASKSDVTSALAPRDTK